MGRKVPSQRSVGLRHRRVQGFSDGFWKPYSLKFGCRILHRCDPVASSGAAFARPGARGLITRYWGNG
jgi:hypothetical protein